MLRITLYSEPFLSIILPHIYFNLLTNLLILRVPQIYLLCYFFPFFFLPFFRLQFYSVLGVLLMKFWSLEDLKIIFLLYVILNFLISILFLTVLCYDYIKRTLSYLLVIKQVFKLFIFKNN